jgi:hypothetical protein
MGKAESMSILIVAEMGEGAIRQPTYAAIAAGLALKKLAGPSMDVLVLGQDDRRAISRRLRWLAAAFSRNCFLRGRLWVRWADSSDCQFPSLTGEGGLRGVVSRWWTRGDGCYD